MNSIIEHFSQHWQDYAAAIGLIIGFVSMIDAYRQRKAKKLETEKNDKLMSFVEMTVDKSQSKEEIELLERKQVELKQTIEQELPKIAKNVVLKEQYHFHATAILSHYQQLTHIDEQLENQTPLPKEVIEYIEKFVVPKHERSERIATVRNLIGYLMGSFAIVNVFVPYPISDLVSVALLVAIAANVFKYNFLKGNLAENHIENGINTGFWVVVAVIASFASLLIFYDAATDFGRYIIAPLIGLTLVISYWKKARITRFFLEVICK